MSHLKVYKASAGSGKTYTLAVEYIKELLLASSVNSHRNILAVTFTKDATGEMKDRILAELYGLAYNCRDSVGFMKSVQLAMKREGLEIKEESICARAKDSLHSILHDYSYLNITTIDSFFQKILRNLARELGKGSKFNLEMNTAKVLNDAVNTMIDSANEKPRLLDWLTTYIENKLDDGGNWRIEKEILNFSRCIFDEHFQEYESALSNRLNSNPGIFEQILKQHNAIQKECKLFFSKAYADIQQLMDSHDLSFSDFSRNGTVINFFKKLSEGEFATANQGSKTIKDCCSDPAKWAAGKSKQKGKIEMFATLNWMPLLNQTLDALRKYHTSGMITRNLHQLGLVWDITNAIRDQNREDNRFMLADTALFLNRMIDDSDAPFIYEKIGAEVKHVMIDEFQDTSRLQWKNFKSMLSNILASNYFSLIVGDVKQSIYRWRNGDWSILNGIEKELNVETETLKVNYRSEAEIVDFNNRFFLHASATLSDKFFDLFDHTSFSPFMKAYDPVNVIQQASKKEKKGFVSINFIQDKSENAGYDELTLRFLLEQLQYLQDKNIKPDQICILSRTNKQIIRIAEYLAAQRESHPLLAAGNYLNIVSNEAFQLNSSTAVRVIIEALRMIVEPENPVYKVQLECLLNPLGTECLTREIPAYSIFAKLENETWNTLPLFELIGHLFRELDLDKLEGQSNYLFTFYDAVNNYLKDFPADIPAFLKYWNEELQYKSVPSGTAVEGVRALTIHKSKGLQFHTVLLPYCDWDLYPEKNPVIWCGPKEGFYDLELLPVKYSHRMYDTIFLDEYRTETAQSWMDNLNLMYVAFTRAEYNLMVLAKNKKKMEYRDDIKNVSDLLRFSIDELGGTFDEEELCFEKGFFDNLILEKKAETDNLLKQTLKVMDVSFVSKAFDPDKSIFKQSNKSREFIHIEHPDQNEYLSKGNVMHLLFSYVKVWDDIHSAVDKVCLEGLIRMDEKADYVTYLEQAILSVGVEDWFSGQYKIYNECNVIVSENGIVTTKRPDRVLVNEEEVIIVDYKFGEKHPSHSRQMREYALLMESLIEKPVKLYLWYVEQNTLLVLK